MPDSLVKPSAALLAEQVFERCAELARCTDVPDQTTRLFLSDAMREVHARVTGWMSGCGLEPRIDAAGNCIGRRAEQGCRRVLLLGSHLDSVPNAGRYDGVLGVLVGLAVCQWLDPTSLPFHLDVLGFSEEEGVRYRMPYLGSAAVTGRFDPAWLNRVDEQGVSMREAMVQFGLDPGCLEACRYDPHHVVGYIETHLEQGPLLERLNLPVGVVTGIAGQSRLRLAVTGEAGHAGTTPMTGRRDALLAAADFVRRVHAECLSLPGLRATVGSMHITPNAPNVIPGHVELTLDLRHLNNEVRKLAVAKMLAEGRRAAKSGNCEFCMLEEVSQNAVNADPGLMAQLRKAVAACGLHPVELESGAGHDAVIMGQAFPMAMLFIRHPGGVSHHPSETVCKEDIATAIEVIGRCVLELAEYERGKLS